MNHLPVPGARILARNFASSRLRVSHPAIGARSAALLPSLPKLHAHRPLSLHPYPPHANLRATAPPREPLPHRCAAGAALPPLPPLRLRVSHFPICAPRALVPTLAALREQFRLRQFTQRAPRSGTKGREETPPHPAPFANVVPVTSCPWREPPYCSTPHAVREALHDHQRPSAVGKLPFHRRNWSPHPNWPFIKTT